MAAAKAGLPRGTPPLQPQLLLLLATALLLASPLPSASAEETRFRPTELSPSIMLLGAFDYEPYYVGSPTSRCTDMVDRAAKFSPSTLNFVVTHYYRQGNDGIKDFCVMGEAFKSCKPFNQRSITAFTDGLSHCLRYASQRPGVQSISITPHLDAYVASGAAWSISTWRNGIVFGPRDKYGGFSYEEIMLTPLAVSLGSSLPPWMPVYLALQGEMGATVFRYPQQYQQLLRSVQDKVQSSRPSPSQVAVKAQAGPSNLGRVSMGLTFNFIFIDGKQGESVNTAARSRGFGNVFGIPIFGRLWTEFLSSQMLGLRNIGGSSAPAFNKSAVRELFTDQRLGFVGISAYAPQRVTFTSNELQNSAFNFIDEVKALLDLDLSGAVLSNTLEIHYSEFGLGGGQSSSGALPASSPEQVAAQPYFGVFGTYDNSKDPWQNKQNRAFMRGFWDTSLGWLMQGGGPTYPIALCHMWNLASWDALAIYPESSSGVGSYADPWVSSLVAPHNQKVAARRKTL